MVSSYVSYFVNRGTHSVKTAVSLYSIVRIGSVGAWVIDIKRGRVISLF
jgi:hypothetical protein